MSRKNIFLRDPWKHVDNDDSGWGNRLICWQTACIINNAMGNTHTIKVLPEEFPELTLVNFPNTEYTTLEEIKAIPIQDLEVQKWIEKEKIELDNKVSYTNKFSYGNTLDLSEKFFDPNTDIFTSIELKNKTLYSKIKNLVKNRIGIHIRRGNGVYVDWYDINTVPSQYRKYYKIDNTADKVYAFIRDEIYFKVIDEYLANNIETKFYLGIDVNVKALTYYKEKYPNKILTCNDVINLNKDLLDELKFLEPRLQLKNMGYNLIDFFSLSCTKEIVHSPPSTWSYTASRISGKNNNFKKSEMTEGKIQDEYNNLNYANHNNNGYKKQYILKSNII